MIAKQNARMVGFKGGELCRKFILSIKTIKKFIYPFNQSVITLVKTLDFSQNQI